VSDITTLPPIAVFADAEGVGSYVDKLRDFVGLVARIENAG
jgi:hypothetical protein